jgi:drug/metabolite transporter (DMT)-like permease
MPTWSAFVLITLCAILWDIGIVLQKLAVDQIPRISFNRRLPAALLALGKSGRWMAGLAASALGWGFFAYALAYTPVSVARAVQGSGFVVLAIFSVLFLRHRLSFLEWIGVALVTSGIAILGIGESSTANTEIVVSFGRLVPALIACAFVCIAAWGLARTSAIGLSWTVAFSVISGTLLGLGDVSTKVLIVLLQRRGVGFAAAGAGAALIVTYISGFLVLSRAYQHGRAILVTAVSDLCSRLVAICMGIIALGEPLSKDQGLRALSVLGYAGIIVGAALLARFSGEEMADELAESRHPVQSRDLQIPDQAEEAELAPRSKVYPDD